MSLILKPHADEVDDGCATESEIDDDLRQYSNILQSLDEVNEIISDLGELGMLLENNDYDQDEHADNFKSDLVTPTPVQAGGRLSPSASIATNLNDDSDNVNQAAQRSSLHIQYKGQYYHLGKLCSLLDEKKKIKQGTRVTRFWNVYADYMQPLMAHQDINLSPRVILKGDHVILRKRGSIDAKGIYIAGKYVLAKVCSLFYVPKESSSGFLRDNWNPAEKNPANHLKVLQYSEHDGDDMEETNISRSVRRNWRGMMYTGDISFHIYAPVNMYVKRRATHLLILVSIR